MGKKSCTKKELESLLGHLSHAATVIPQGHTFLRSLFSLLSLALAPYHNLHLNLSARTDIKWWGMFLSDWNGRSFFPAPLASIHVTSDASGCFGCGGFSIPYGWFQEQCPERWRDTHITAKELLPVVIAAALSVDRKVHMLNSDIMAESTFSIQGQPKTRICCAVYHSIFTQHTIGLTLNHATYLGHKTRQLMLLHAITLHFSSPLFHRPLKCLYQSCSHYFLSG